VTMKISLREGLDKKLYKLLSDLYSPFLSAQHLKDRFQYTIFDDSVPFPIGIVSVNKGKNTFLQIALIPDLQAAGVGRLVIDELVKETKLRRIGWSCEKNNYPSLKLLCSLGGGVTENSVKQKKKKTFEGFFYADKPISKKLRDIAAAQLANTRQEYGKWVRDEYKARSSELRELRRYLLQHVSIIDIHSHQITSTSVSAKLLPDALKKSLCYPATIPKISCRLAMGVPDCSLDLAKINDEVFTFCGKHGGTFPVAILDDNTDVASMIRKGAHLFKEHAYGQKLLKTSSGKFANVSVARLKKYNELAAAGVPLLMHVGPNVVERVSAISRKVPKLKMILAHLASPMDHCKPFDQTFDDLLKLKELGTVFFDISAITDVHVVERAFGTVPENRLLWGSDFPYDCPQKSIDRLMGSFRLSIGQLVGLLSNNARNVIKAG